MHLATAFRGAIWCRGSVQSRPGVHRSNEMQLFCERSVSSEANGSWRCARSRIVVEVVGAFGRGRSMPSSPSKPPLTRIYLVEEPTLTAVTKLGPGCNWSQGRRTIHWLFAGAQVGYPPTICRGLCKVIALLYGICRVPEPLFEVAVVTCLASATRLESKDTG